MCYIPSNSCRVSDIMSRKNTNVHNMVVTAEQFDLFLKDENKYS